MKLEFYGAAGGVTGSHMVVDGNDYRIGIDAGLFQGSETDQNRQDFGHSPRSLNALILTHAHIDHSGRIPLLVKEGFSGPIYSTPATADLCEIMLRDSAHLMEEAADHEDRHFGERRGPSRRPLYTQDDVEKSLQRFRPIDYGRELKAGGFSFKFKDAGHIIGSAMVELTFGSKKLVFSSDLGRPGSPILRDPEVVDQADWLVMESTYGDKDHGDISDRGQELLGILLETLKRGGNIVIPAFAIGRTQEILFELNRYAELGKLKGFKCFVDSPMAISGVEIYRRHPECFDEETYSLFKRGDSPFDFPGIKYARSKGESKAINDSEEPHIIISASGMCTGGRVLHHLIHNLERKESTILFVGYQAEGTLGRRLLEGSKTVRVLNKQLEVRAKIKSLGSFSAHAGRGEIMDYLRSIKRFPGQVFLNHGEPNSTKALAQAIQKEFGAKTIIPRIMDSYKLG